MTRSEVKICILKKDYEMLKEIPKVKELFEEGRMEIHEKTNADIVILGWDSIKWSPEFYEDERLLVEFLRENPERPYLLIEIPEELEYDIQIEENYHKGECSGWMGISRTIEIY